MIQMGLATVKEYCYVFLARITQDNMTMKKAVKKSGGSIRPERSPVIAIRVPAPLHQAITKTAKASGVTMSEYVAQLIARGQEWQGLIDSARNVLSQANAEAKRMVDSALEAELRRRNWKRNAATGSWTPPEVHGLPPDGFIAAAEAAAGIAAVEAAPKKKGRVK